MLIRPFLQIAAGDIASKALLVGINLYLIRLLAIDEYSHFTMLLNAVFVGYQLACGPLERLYIAEHERFSANLTSLGWVLSTISASVGILWLWQYIVLTDALLIFGGVLVLSVYQMQRIRMQQRMLFAIFSFAEVVKNSLWLLLLLVFLGTTQIPPAESSLSALLVGTLVAVVALKAFGPAHSKDGLKGSSGMGRVLWDARYVVAYSAIGAVVPYLPVIMATTAGSDVITATYGAAMRYQAILGMAVFAFNTVLLPQMAALGRAQQARDRLLKQLRRSAPWALLIFVLAVASIWSVIPYVDNGKYPLLPTAFLILAVTPALSLVAAPYVNMLLVDGRARVVLACMLVGLAVNWAGYLLLGGSRNPLGPAVASALAYLTITTTLILCWASRRVRAERNT